jgi:hypothetical protein
MVRDGHSQDEVTKTLIGDFGWQPNSTIWNYVDVFPSGVKAREQTRR